MLADLGAAAPTLTKLTRKTAPFADATRKSLLSLGDAAAKSTEPLVKSDPVVIDLRDLSRATVSPSKDLRKLLFTLQKTGGYQNLLKFLYDSALSTNAFDKFGHFLRAQLLVTSCVDYALAPQTGCGANFTGPGSSKTGAPRSRSWTRPAATRPRAPARWRTPRRRQERRAPRPATR